MSQKTKEFSALEGFAICLGMIAVQLATQIIAQWGQYFYSSSEGTGRTVYITALMATFMFAAVGTIWDAITDPIIGTWSDRTSTQPGKLRRLIPISGRRRPFIFFGSLFLVFTSIFFWYPPINNTSMINFLFGTLMLCAHWTVFTITVVPLTSLGPEIARSEKGRVSLGIWTAVGMVVGLAMAIVLPGILFTFLDPARDTGQFSPVGYQRTAMIFAVIAFILFQAPVWLVKERYDSSTAEENTVSHFKALGEAFRNFPFIIYCLAFFLFNTGFIAVQTTLPYFAELGLGGDESTVSVLLIPFILVCVIFFVVIPKLTHRLHTKWMTFLAFFIISTGMPFMYFIPRVDASLSLPFLANPVDLRIILAGSLFAYCGIGQSITYVMMTPMLGEVIDCDEARYGKRREALFNGLHSFILKIAIAGAMGISTLSMHFFGKSVEIPTGVYLVGPIAGFFGFLGMIAILFYPNVDIARKKDVD